MFFKTDILSRYLHKYGSTNQQDLKRSYFDSELRNGYALNYSHFHTFNNDNRLVLGVCIIEKENTLSSERMLSIDFYKVEIRYNRTRHQYVPGTSFFEFCQMNGMSKEESELAYTLAKMVGIRIGSSVL